VAKKKHQTPPEDEPQPEFIIRAGEGRLTSCANCGRRVMCTGPTGHRDGEVVCDWCLVEGSHELGMVLAVVSVVRAYAGVAADSPKHHMEALHELGAFARIYETFAAKSGPARIFRIPGFTDRIPDDPSD
jgi:hypothetical protein